MNIPAFPTAFLFIAALAIANIHTAATASGAAESLDPVLIQGANVVVRKSDFDLELKNVPPDRRGEILLSKSRVERTLETLFQNKVLIADARERGFDKDPQVQAELNYARDQRLASMYFAYLTRQVKIPDMELRAREMYKLNAKNYAQPERVKASHILISNKKHPPEEARKLAEEVRQKALAGEDFEKLAVKYSEDSSVRMNNGQLGFFAADQMVPTFSKAAFAMKKSGEISQVVETEYGFHVIRHEEHRPARTPAYEELRLQFLEEASRDHIGFTMQTNLSKMIEKAVPKPIPAEIEKLLVVEEAKALFEGATKIQK